MKLALRTEFSSEPGQVVVPCRFRVWFCRALARRGTETKDG
jgi:hypothetical protein